MVNDTIADQLSLESYVIQREHGIHLGGMPFDIKDRANNLLFRAKTNLLGTEITIQDTAGNILGQSRHKLVSITPTFYLYDGDAQQGKLVAIVKRPVMENMANTFSEDLTIEDQSGAVVARASGKFNGFLNYEYNITSNQGEQIGTISTGTPGEGLKNLISIGGFKRTLTLNITKQGILPNIILLEFLITIELKTIEEESRAHANTRREGPMFKI